MRGEAFVPMRKGFYGLRVTLLTAVRRSLPDTLEDGLANVAGNTFETSKIIL